jgi:hypothetical protein
MTPDTTADDGASADPRRGIWTSHVALKLGFKMED